MCSYNHEKYIEDSINSVLNQTFPDLELLITDDCSTDSSPKIIGDYVQKDPRVHAVFHTKNWGISRTLNDSLEQVRGKYVCFQDSDDLWAINKLEKQLKILGKSDSKVLWSEGEVIDSQGKKTGMLVTQLLRAFTNKSGYLFESLLKEQFILRQSMICKAEYVKNLRCDLGLKYVNDHRFLVDLAFNHEFQFISEPLVKYRWHSNNASKKNELVWARDKIRVRKYFLVRYGDRISPKAKADIAYQIGFYLSRLGENAEAKKYYLQALKIDHTHLNSTLYTALTLTTGKGFPEAFLTYAYNLTTALLYNLKTRLV
jgi:teichuronic acid biosynthesis glycosyltransferase TuaG